jgi:chromosome segregation ATPase
VGELRGNLVRLRALGESVARRNRRIHTPPDELIEQLESELARVREELKWMREREAESVPPETFKAVRARAEKAEAERDAEIDNCEHYRAQYAAAAQHDRQRAEQAESRLGDREEQIAKLDAFLTAALPVISEHIDWIEGRGPRFASTHDTSSRDSKYALDLAREALTVLRTGRET